MVLTTAHRKDWCYYEIFTKKASDPDCYFGTTLVTKQGHEVGTWKVRRLYRAGSVTAGVSELARYKLDLVGVQVRWGGVGSGPQ